jgi:comEA protein
LNQSSEQHELITDWTRTPAAIFASSVLIIIAVLGITLAWNRSNQNTNPSDLVIHQLGKSSLSTDDIYPETTSDFQVIHRVDINTATPAELDLIPGIGPSLAQSIIEYRRDHGRFDTIEGLDEVSGIGPKTIEKIQGYAIVTQGG